MGITIDGLDNVLKKLKKMSDQSQVETVAKKAVAAASDINISAMRSSIARAEGNGKYHTGSVAASVTGTPVKVNAYGVYMVAKTSGYDARGVSNTFKASMLEGGVPGHLDARPWRQAAIASAQGQCEKIMEDVIRSEMEAEQ